MIRWIDARGDINLNEFCYEKEDLLLFIDYFLHGLSVFDINLEGQIAATDVNADGISLSIDDLAVLFKRANGKLIDYPKGPEIKNFDFTYKANNIISANDTLVLAHIKVKGKTQPIFLIENMVMKYAHDSINTNIFIYSFDSSYFTGDFIQIDSDIIEFNFVSKNYLDINLGYFDLDPQQNLFLFFPRSGYYKVKILDKNNSVLKSFSGLSKPGKYTFEWDNSDIPDGKYTYEITFDEQTISKTINMVK